MKKALRILLVEDDWIDIKGVKRALQALNTPVELDVVSHGRQALDYLRECTGIDGSKCPSLILLDLNMPVMNGVEFLEVIKRDNVYRMIPVIVLTTSAEHRDIDTTYKLGAAGYFVKSMDGAAFNTTIETIHSYWRRCEYPSVSL